jgi:hypothetical protein
MWEFKFTVKEYSPLLGQLIDYDNYEVPAVVGGVHLQNIARPYQTRIPVPDQLTEISWPKTISQLIGIRNLLYQPMIY